MTEIEKLIYKYAQRMVSAHGGLREDYVKELRLFAAEIVAEFVEAVRQAFRKSFGGG